MPLLRPLYAQFWLQSTVHSTPLTFLSSRGLWQIVKFQSKAWKISKYPKQGHPQWHEDDGSYLRSTLHAPMASSSHSAPWECIADASTLHAPSVYPPVIPTKFSAPHLSPNINVMGTKAPAVVVKSTPLVAVSALDAASAPHGHGHYRGHLGSRDGAAPYCAQGVWEIPTKTSATVLSPGSLSHSSVCSQYCLGSNIYGLRGTASYVSRRSHLLAKHEPAHLVTGIFSPRKETQEHTMLAELPLCSRNGFSPTSSHILEECPGCRGDSVLLFLPLFS
jgi:hypothetical protein